MLVVFTSIETLIWQEINFWWFLLVVLTDVTYKWVYSFEFIYPNLTFEGLIWKYQHTYNIHFIFLKHGA